MGMQISRGVHTEVPAQSAIRAVAAGFGAGVSGSGGAEGVQSGGGAPDARPRAYAAERAAEVFGIERDGVYQGEERDPHSTGICWPAKEFRGAALLGARLLGVDGWQERGCRAPLHPGPGERRQTPRTTGDDGALSASR